MNWHCLRLTLPCLNCHIAPWKNRTGVPHSFFPNPNPHASICLVCCCEWGRVPLPQGQPLLPAAGRCAPWPLSPGPSIPGNDPETAGHIPSLCPVVPELLPVDPCPLKPDFCPTFQVRCPSARPPVPVAKSLSPSCCIFLLFGSFSSFQPPPGGAWSLVLSLLYTHPGEPLQAQHFTLQPLPSCQLDLSTYVSPGHLKPNRNQMDFSIGPCPLVFLTSITLTISPLCQKTGLILTPFATCPMSSPPLRRVNSITKSILSVLICFSLFLGQSPSTGHRHRPPDLLTGLPCFLVLSGQFSSQ